MGSLWASPPLNGSKRPTELAQKLERADMNPAPRLTQSFAHEIKANGRKQRFADQKVPGLYLRVAPGGKKTWIIRYRKLDRSSAEMTIGQVSSMPLEVARAQARQGLSEVSMGGDPIRAKRQARQAAIDRNARTLAGVAERYRRSPAYTTKRESTRSGYDISLNIHILPRIGNLPVDEIGRREVAELLDTLHAERGGSVSNAARAALSVLMAYATEHDFAPFNPVRDVKRRHKMVRRDRMLTDEELRELWRATGELDGMGEVVASMIRVCMFMPARVGEIAGATWTELDLEAALWTVKGERMKNGKDHEMPLSAPLVSLLKEIKRGTNSAWVFPALTGQGPMDGKRAGRACNRFAAKRGWSSFGPHDLRRTYATRMADLGFEQSIIERTLGHDVSSGRAIAHYDHSNYRERKREALNAWANQLGTVLSVAYVQ